MKTFWEIAGGVWHWLVSASGTTILVFVLIAAALTIGEMIWYHSAKPGQGAGSALQDAGCARADGAREAGSAREAGPARDASDGGGAGKEGAR